MITLRPPERWSSLTLQPRELLYPHCRPFRFFIQALPPQMLYSWLCMAFSKEGTAEMLFSPHCKGFWVPIRKEEIQKQACLAAGVIQGGSEGVQQVCEGAGIEEVPQLSCEELELLHKVSAVLCAGRCDALQHLLSSDEVLRARVPM